MIAKWKEVKQQISAFRKYVHSLSPEARKEASFCYLITEEEINKLLSQCNDGSKLHGLRVYIGAKIVDNSMVPVLHVVACHKDGDNNYNDYNVPNAISEESKSLPLLGSTQPCPTCCSTSNALNQ